MDFNGHADRGGRAPRRAAGEPGRSGATSRWRRSCRPARSWRTSNTAARRRSPAMCALSASRAWIPAPAAARMCTPPASVGQIKVIGVQKYKSGVRVSILCGRRALEDENAAAGTGEEAAGQCALRADGRSFPARWSACSASATACVRRATRSACAFSALMAQGEMDKAVRVAGLRRAPRFPGAEGGRTCWPTAQGRHLCFMPREGRLELCACLPRRRMSAPSPKRSARRSAGKRRRAEGHDPGRSFLRYRSGDSGRD